MKLSIIIPVYNREAYIEETLRSILDQRDHALAYEIVVVDDGSTDGSVAVCEGLAKSYSCIRVVRQRNAGPGAARNNGLAHARGEYVWFFDSDDWMEQGALASLTSHLSFRGHGGTGVRGYEDAITFAAADVMEGEKRRRIFYEGMDGQVMSGRQLMERQIRCGFLSLSFRFSVCLWHNIYRRGLLEQHQLRLAEGSLVDDFDFAPRVFGCLERVLVLNEVLYLVRQTPNSITRSANPRKAFDYLACARSLYAAAAAAEGADRRRWAVFASLAFCNSMTEIHRTGQVSDDYLNAVRAHRAVYKSMLRATGNGKFLLMAGLLSVSAAWLVGAYPHYLARLKWR